MKYLILFFSIFNLKAQIADASFFSSVKSINPGVIHLGKENYTSAEYAQEEHVKHHDVPLGGIVGGINTNVNLKRQNAFLGLRGKMIGAEVLYDKSAGEYVQAIKNPTRGDRTITNSAEAAYFGGNLDLFLLGLSYGKSDFNFLNEFRVGVVPDLTAHDELINLSYTNLKVGTALPISFFRLGVYYLIQNADGDYQYTYYDGTTGNQGSKETTHVELKSNGLGVGLGLTLARFRSEISYEKMNKSKASFLSDYPGDVVVPESSSRISFVSELKFYSFNFGLTYKIMKGNYADLFDIIASNILYKNLNSSDSRNELGFKFSYGSSKGFSPSIFYTTSEIKNKELSPVFDNGLEYDATTKVTAFGASIQYAF